MNATAAINDEDSNSGNNNRTHSFRLDVQDVAIVDLAASMHRQEIVATVENAGTGNLSSVVVLLCYDSSFAGDEWWDYTRLAFDLLVGDRTRLFFSWDMSACPDPLKYEAEALPMPYETITENNTLTCAHPLGDLNGDFLVNIQDVVMVSSIYGSKQGDSIFDPAIDMDCDGVITILDLVICASHYGDKWAMPS